MADYLNTALSEVPADWMVPGTYVQVRPDYSQVGILPYPARMLIIAQKTSGGNATSGAVYQVFNAAQAKVLFGAGSPAALAAEAAIASNPFVPLDVIGFSDAGSSTAATGTIQITNASGINTTEVFDIGGVAVPVGVASTDTAANIATKLAAKVNAMADLPVTAAVSTDTVTLTCRVKGTFGNAIMLRAPDNARNGNLSQLYCSITAMASGATNPDVSTAITNIASTWYTDIALTFLDSTNIGLMVTELARRYTGFVRQDAKLFVGYKATMSDALSLPASGLNTQYIVRVPVQNPKTHPAFVGAAVMAAACYRSVQDPALQFRGIVLPGIAAPDPLDRFTETERNTLLQGGASSFISDSSGAFILERLVTTYTSNGIGPDTAWSDLMALNVPTRIRYDWRQHVSLQWPANKLAHDGSRAAEIDPKVVTPSRLKASWAGRSRIYEEVGWIENTDALAKQARFEIDRNDRNRVNAYLPIQRMGNLMVLAAELAFQV